MRSTPNASSGLQRLEAWPQSEGRVRRLRGLQHGELDDAALDEVSVDGASRRSPGLASERVTAAVTIKLGATTIVAVTRLIERRMEQRRQVDSLRIVADGLSDLGGRGSSSPCSLPKHANGSI